MLLIKLLLKEVTEDESVIPIFEMGEGCNDANEALESLRVISRKVESFMRRRMGLGDDL